MTSEAHPGTARAIPSTSRAVEAEELVASWRSALRPRNVVEGKKLELLLDTITRLAADKARLEEELAEFQKLAGSADKLAWSMAERADKAEAELSALKARVAEVLEPFASTTVLEPNGVIVGLERYHFKRAASLHAEMSELKEGGRE